MEGLCSAFPNAVLLESFRRAGSFTARNRHIGHENIYRVVRSIANKLLIEAHKIGKHRQYSGMGLAQATPTTAPITKTATEEDISELQTIFATEVGDKTIDTFTLRPEEAAALLAQRSLSELQGLCEAVGNWVWIDRTQSLMFHDQDSIVTELFRRARVPVPEVAQ